MSQPYKDGRNPYCVYRQWNIRQMKQSLGRVAWTRPANPLVFHAPTIEEFAVRKILIWKLARLKDSSTLSTIKFCSAVGYGKGKSLHK